MAKRKTFQVYYSQGSSTEDENLFCINGPGTEYVARNKELARFIEKMLNSALVTFSETKAK